MCAACPGNTTATCPPWDACVWRIPACLAAGSTMLFTWDLWPKAVCMCHRSLSDMCKQEVWNACGESVGKMRMCVSRTF